MEYLKKTNNIKPYTLEFLVVFIELNFDINFSEAKKIFEKPRKIPTTGEPEFIIKTFKIKPKNPQQFMLSGGEEITTIGFTYNNEDYISEAPEYIFNYLFYLFSQESPVLYPTVEEVLNKWNEIIERKVETKFSDPNVAT